MVFALVTVVLMAVAAGCSGSVPPPTADVDATVEARVGATREADLATAEARAEATRAAAPTDTPVPTPTLVPTLVPTPKPYVAAPGSVERGVDALYACLQAHEGFRAAYISGMELSGLRRESAEDLVDLFLEDKDLFVQAFLESAEADPEGASMLSLLSTELEEFCGDVGLESGSFQDLSMSDAEARAVLEAFYDCVNSDEEVRSYFLSLVEDDGLGQELFSELLSMDRDLFVGLVLPGAKQDPDAPEILSVIDDFVGLMCR